MDTNQSNSDVGVTGRLTEGDLLYVRSLESAVEILRNELSKYRASDEMLNECCADLNRVEAERDTALRISEQHSDVVNNMIVQLATSQAEIERLKSELEAETQRRWDGNRIASDEATADFNEMRDIAVKEMARWAHEAEASQAREKKLREALSRLYTEYEYQESIGHIPRGRIEKDFASIGLALPTDDSALQEAIKQGQREAAEHILEMWRDPWPRAPHRFIDRLETYVEELK
jgi:hypothetical protein